MRGLSLVALLVVIGIMLILYAQNFSAVSKVKNKIEPQAQQISGRDATGTPVAETYTLKAELGGVRVTWLAQSSVMKSTYGLQDNDLIVGAAGEGGVMMRARDIDAESLKAQVAAAYQYQQPIEVLRNGQTITLTPHANTNAGQSRASDDHSVKDQLDRITKPR